MVRSCKMSTEVQLKMSKLLYHCNKYIETARSDYKNSKGKDTTLPENNSNIIMSKSQKETNSIPLEHKYTTAHFNGLVQKL